MSNTAASQLRTKYDFKSDILDIIIGGQSTLDSTTAFQVASLDEADLFIKSYGYDLENPIERAELQGNFHEALNFIRNYFLQPENPNGLKLEIPRKILELNDVRELFLMIHPNRPELEKLEEKQKDSELPRALAQNWACSILKVMHTIAHIDKDLRSSYFTEIQKQIFDRFYRSIHRDAEGKLFLGEKEDDPTRVNLIAFETKPKKSRESIILKLLHKSENVAEDIFDRVGIRFIAETPIGALRVIKYLKDKMIIMAPNIKPSRSRNSLILMSDFEKELKTFLSKINALPSPSEGELQKLESSFREKVNQLLISESSTPENPHTSAHYRALQFTCRQLIKLRNPLYDDLKELKSLSKQKPLDEDWIKAIDRIDLKYTQREIRFFYPYEIQVVDQASALENERGKSAHSEYKKSQIYTAMRRVMGPLMVSEANG
jgi:uncharacterized protein (TIGR04562 family)